MSAEHEGQHETDKCHLMHYGLTRTCMKHEHSYPVLFFLSFELMHNTCIMYRVNNNNVSGN